MKDFILKGRVWKYSGDNISVNYFLSGKYDPIGNNPSESSKHVLEDVDSTFVQKVRKGDIIVGGKGFGVGKHHPNAIRALTYLGIAGFIAESFNPMFLEQCIDSGIPALAFKDIAPKLQTGDMLELNASTGEAKVTNRGIIIKTKPASEVILSILDAGGLEPYTLRRLGVHE